MKSASQSPTLPAKQIVSLDKEEVASSPSARPLLSHFFGGRTKSKPRIRIGSDDELLKKNRRQIDNYLRRLGALMGKEVSLNAEGMSYFSYKKFVVVVEVPMDHNNNVYIYTMVSRVGATDNLAAVLKKAMELNYMEYLTRGATLGLDGEEVNLCFSTPISGLPFCDLKAAMENFLLTTSEVNEQLEAVKKSASLRNVLR